MAKYTIHSTKEDYAKAYSKIKNLEKNTSIPLDWKKIKSVNLDELNVMIDILEKFSKKPSVQTIKMRTGMGKITSDSDPMLFLSEGEKNELDSIGYSGKTTDGKRISRESYLNSLKRGDFTVQQTKFDHGDFCEEFTITRIL